MSRAALCCAPPDVEFATNAADYLNLHTSLLVEVVDSGGSTGSMLDLIEQCLAHEFVFVVVSDAWVPSPWPRNLWEPILIDSVREAGCHVAYLIRNACAFPPLLRRNRCFESLPELRRWTIHELHPDRFVPAIADSGDPDESLIQLVDQAGVATNTGRGNAVWFVKNYWGHFENVYWVEFGGSSRASVIGEFCRAMNLRLPGTVDQNWDALLKEMHRTRSLFVCENTPSAALLPGGKASVILLAHAENAIQQISLHQLSQMFFDPNADDAVCLRELGRFIEGNNEPLDWDEVKPLGSRALLLLKRQARLAEAYDLLQWLAPQAKQVRDIQAWNQLRWEEDWILDSWGLPPGERALLIKTQPSQLYLPLS